MSGAEDVGLTISNTDAYFMTLGASTPTFLDTTMSQISVMLGSSLRPSNPILNQAGDSYFLQRFALQSHGSYDQAAAMRFALEHQTPPTVGAVSGGPVIHTLKLRTLIFQSQIRTSSSGLSNPPTKVSLKESSLGSGISRHRQRLSR